MCDAHTANVCTKHTSLAQAIMVCNAYGARLCHHAELVGAKNGTFNKCAAAGLIATLGNVCGEGDGTPATRVHLGW